MDDNFEIGTISQEQLLEDIKEGQEIQDPEFEGDA